MFRVPRDRHICMHGCVPNTGRNPVVPPKMLTPASLASFPHPLQGPVRRYHTSCGQARLGQLLIGTQWRHLRVRSSRWGCTERSGRWLPEARVAWIRIVVGENLREPDTLVSPRSAASILVVAPARSIFSRTRKFPIFSPPSGTRERSTTRVDISGIAPWLPFSHTCCTSCTATARPRSCRRARCP